MCPVETADELLRVGIATRGYMKKGGRVTGGVLLAAMICLGVGGCGPRDGDLSQNEAPGATLPATVSVQNGTVVTDSWGYTGSDPVQVMAPSQAALLLAPHTLLLDSGKYVVSGITVTRIAFSSDPSTLSQAAQASAPGILVCYLDLSLGAAKSALPAGTATVTAGALAPGETVTVYSFDAVTGKWTSAQSAPVDGSGKVTFPVNQFALWALFR